MTEEVAVPFAGEPAAAITVSLVRSGQPRAYADHERVYHVRFLSVRRKYAGQPIEVKDGRHQWKSDEDAERAEREQIALTVVAFGYPVGYPKDETFPTSSYVSSVSTLDNGDVEIIITRPFYD